MVTVVTFGPTKPGESFVLPTKATEISPVIIFVPVVLAAGCMLACILLFIFWYRRRFRPMLNENVEMENTHYHAC